MNRREFIKTLLALGASVTLPLDIAAATDSELEAAWEGAGFAFDVQDYGTIWVADFNEPATRAEAYGITLEYVGPKYPGELIRFAESSPLGYRLQEVYEDYRWELLGLADDSETSPARRAARKLLKRLPDDPDYGWQIWLEVEPESAWKQFEPVIGRFLDEPPDAEEWEFLPDSANAQGAAYRYFRDHEDWEVLEKLDIEIVDGECPGSSYFAAELRTPVDEANRIAKALDLPYRFRQS